MSNLKESSINRRAKQTDIALTTPTINTRDGLVLYPVSETNIALEKGIAPIL